MEKSNSQRLSQLNYPISAPCRLRYRSIGPHFEIDSEVRKRKKPLWKKNFYNPDDQQFQFLKKIIILALIIAVSCLILLEISQDDLQDQIDITSAYHNIKDESDRQKDELNQCLMKNQQFSLELKNLQSRNTQKVEKSQKTELEVESQLRLYHQNLGKKIQDQIKQVSQDNELDMDLEDTFSFYDFYSHFMDFQNALIPFKQCEKQTETIFIHLKNYASSFQGAQIIENPLLTTPMSPINVFMESVLGITGYDGVQNLLDDSPEKQPQPICFTDNLINITVVLNHPIQPEQFNVFHTQDYENLEVEAFGIDILDLNFGKFVIQQENLLGKSFEVQDENISKQKISVYCEEIICQQKFDFYKFQIRSLKQNEICLNKIEVLGINED